MLNDVTLVGKLHTINDKRLIITLKRAYDTEERDFVPVIIDNNDLIKQLKEGDTIGLKGKIINDYNEIVVKASNISCLGKKEEN